MGKTDYLLYSSFSLNNKKGPYHYDATVMKKYLFSVLFLSCCMATSLLAAELETIENASLIEAGLNDGDSFKVKADDKELHLRLYYVDCLETTLSKEKNRILEQQYHFGLEDPVAVVRFGKQAAEYVKRVLSRPFTIYTSYAKAPGRRYYAFIETHDGRDLVTSWSNKAWRGYTAKPTRPLTAHQANS